MALLNSSCLQLLLGETDAQGREDFFLPGIRARQSGHRCLLIDVVQLQTKAAQRRQSMGDSDGVRITGGPASA